VSAACRHASAAAHQALQDARADACAAAELFVEGLVAQAELERRLAIVKERRAAWLAIQVDPDPTTEASP
jgi:hypothetical protein